MCVRTPHEANTRTRTHSKQPAHRAPSSPPPPPTLTGYIDFCPASCHANILYSYSHTCIFVIATSRMWRPAGRSPFIRTPQTNTHTHTSTITSTSQTSSTCTHGEGIHDEQVRFVRYKQKRGAHVSRLTFNVPRFLRPPRANAKLWRARSRVCVCTCGVIRRCDATRRSCNMFTIRISCAHAIEFTHVRTSIHTHAYEHMRRDQTTYTHTRASTYSRRRQQQRPNPR